LAYYSFYLMTSKHTPAM